MRSAAVYFFSVLVFACAFSLSSLVGAASATKERFPPKVCNNRTRGPDLEKQQQAALADFAHLYVDLQDVQTAFDRWVPG